MNQVPWTTGKLHIRRMISKDLPQVLAVEHACFEFPWQEDDFIVSLRQRNCIGMCVKRNDWVLGYMIYDLHKALHVLNFAVHPLVRRFGVGRMMAKKLIGKLSPSKRTRILLEIRESNVDAQVFFRAMGFKAVDVLPDFYDDTPEDAYLFVYKHADKHPRKRETRETMDDLCDRLFTPPSRLAKREE